MSDKPIRQRWRDQQLAPDEQGPEKVAVRFFRSLKPVARDPRSVARLRNELIARAEKRETSSGGRQPLLGGRQPPLGGRQPLLGGRQPLRWRISQIAIAALLLGSFGGALAAVHPVGWVQVRERVRELVREMVARRPAHAGVPAVSKGEPPADPTPMPVAVPAPEPVVAPAAVAEPELPHRSRPRETHSDAPAPTVAAPGATGLASAASPPDDSLAIENSMVEQALAALAQQRPREALAALAAYRQRFPHGKMEYEADLNEFKAQMALGQNAAALAVLDRANALGGFDALPRSPEVSVLRAELLLRTGDCAGAVPAFSRQLDDEHLESGLQERALFGRAVCYAKLGQRAESRRALRDYLNRFPRGRFVPAAQDALDPLK